MKKYSTKIKSLLFFASIAAFSQTSYAQIPTASVQFINNSADPDFNKIDIYVKGVLAYDDFEFRKATAFIEVPAGIDYELGIAKSTSTSFNDVIVDSVFNFAATTKHIIVADGVDGAGFEVNPQGRTTSLALLHFPAAKEEAGSVDPGTVQLAGLHGVTDIHVVDLLRENGDTLINNIGYGDFSHYKIAPPSPFLLYLTNYFDKDTMGIFTANFTDFKGQAGLLFLSGFRNPANNNNGPALALLAAFPDGTVLELTNQLPLGIQVSQANNEGVSVFPVPAKNNMTVEFFQDKASNSQVAIYNMAGVLVQRSEEQFKAGKNTLQLNTDMLATGQYILKLQNNEQVQTVLYTVLK